MNWQFSKDTPDGLVIQEWLKVTILFLLLKKISE